MLNEATKKAMVTEMTPPDLATHLKLDADRHSTLRSDEVSGGQLCELEIAEPAHEHVDRRSRVLEHTCFGKTAKGNGKSKGKGKTDKE